MCVCVCVCNTSVDGASLLSTVLMSRRCPRQVLMPRRQLGVPMYFLIEQTTASTTYFT